MTRETHAERKDRERKRDAIRELGYVTAERIARGAMTTCERVIRDDFPAIQFGEPLDVWRCKCGAHMSAFPTYSRTYGWTPTFFCAYCDLDSLVRACRKIDIATGSQESA